MKITRRQLRQIIKEELLREGPAEFSISVESGELSQDKIAFNSTIHNAFRQGVGGTTAPRPELGETLVFTVTKSNVSGPNKGKDHVEKARKILDMYDHIPDGVTLKVTYSNPDPRK